MNRIWKPLLSIILLVTLGWVAFGFLGIQALFFDNQVKEDVPDSIMKLISKSPPQDAVADKVDSIERVLGKGAFEQGDSTYSISGNAFLSQIGEVINLTFTDFEVSNGPDLFVYAVRTDTTVNKTIKETVAKGEFINLGTLKGNIGNQNYTLDKQLDHKAYQVISIWCRRFSRNFGSVKLSPSRLELISRH
ncbi:MAG: DM13 domain-containing protein [Verrucomicrobiota bacterium]